MTNKFLNNFSAIRIFALTLIILTNLEDCAIAESSVNNSNISKTETSRFYINKGKQFELCQEIKKILDEPENKNFGKPYLTNSEFVIPKKYSNFQVPVWQDVSMEELPKYMASEKWLKRIRDFNENYKSKPAQVLIQRTRVDLNHDGKVDDILRISTDNKFYGIQGMLGTEWHCYASDVILSPMGKEFSDGIKAAGECTLLNYKGKVFVAEESGFNTITIHEPITPIQRTEFGYKSVCYIEFTPSESKTGEAALFADGKKRRASKEYQEFLAERAVEIEKEKSQNQLQQKTQTTTEEDHD